MGISEYCEYLYSTCSVENSVWLQTENEWGTEGEAEQLWLEALLLCVQQFT